MAYIFDTNCFIVIGHYYPEQFPSFWGKIHQAVENGKIISVREVRRELDRNAAEDHLVEWIETPQKYICHSTSSSNAIGQRIFQCHIAEHRYRIEHGWETILSRIRLLLLKQRS